MHDSHTFAVSPTNWYGSVHGMYTLWFTGVELCMQYIAL